MVCCCILVCTWVVLLLCFIYVVYVVVSVCVYHLLVGKASGVRAFTFIYVLIVCKETCSFFSVLVVLNM